MIDLHNFEKFSKKCECEKGRREILTWCYSEIAVKIKNIYNFFFAEWASKFSSSLTAKRIYLGCEINSTVLPTL